VNERLHVLVCPQEFKGSLTAFEAASALAAGVRRAEPAAEVVELPLADGGPGTAAIVSAHAGGELVDVEVTGPLGTRVTAQLALLPPRPDGTPIAVIEAAAAAGLALVEPDHRDPGRATTFGVGELVRAALDRGARELIVGVGGTASNDGGAGAAQALGYRLLDANGEPLLEPAGGLDLAGLASIDHSGVDRRLAEVDVRVAVDVTNVLLGPEGATAVYGAQKGVDGELAPRLEGALERWAEALASDLGVEVIDLLGGGAGGGLAAGLIAAIGGRIESGASLVANAIGLEDAIREADLVITGEGRLDAQTTYGKAVELVTALAERYETPCLVVAGSAEGATDGVTDLETLTGEGIGEAEAMRRAAELAEVAAERVVRRAAWDRGARDAEVAATRALIEAGEELRRDGLVTSHGGNLSARRARGGALISATGAMLGRLTSELLVAVDANGAARDPEAPAPSSDSAVHLAIYEAHPEAGAVLHAHPVHAVALAFDRDAIEPANLEGRLFLGRVPVLDVEWEASAEPVAEALRECPVVVVRGHGSYARGVDVWDALRVTSALEEAARMLALSGR
jgi:glycerate kinase